MLREVADLLVELDILLFHLLELLDAVHRALFARSVLTLQLTHLMPQRLVLSLQNVHFAHLVAERLVFLLQRVDFTLHSVDSQHHSNLEYT